MSDWTTETITWHPVADGLPDPASNVLLALSDGTSCEGFLEDEPGDRNVWRDVTAEQLGDGVVTHWAEMPKGPST